MLLTEIICAIELFTGNPVAMPSATHLRIDVANLRHEAAIFASLRTIGAIHSAGGVKLVVTQVGKQTPRAAVRFSIKSEFLTAIAECILPNTCAAALAPHIVTTRTRYLRKLIGRTYQPNPDVLPMADSVQAMLPDQTGTAIQSDARHVYHFNRNSAAHSLTVLHDLIGA